MTERNSTRQRTEPTPRQARYVEALIGGASYAAAAKAAGVSERSGRAWRGDPLVVAALRDARTRALGDATTKSVARLSAAIDVLTMIAADKDMPASARVAAARSLGEWAVRFVETLDLVQRIEALEAAQPAEAGRYGPGKL
jgi:hypothetical protein